MRESVIDGGRKATMCVMMYDEISGGGVYSVSSVQMHFPALSVRRSRRADCHECIQLWYTLRPTYVHSSSLHSALFSRHSFQSRLTSLTWRNFAVT